MFYNSSGEAWMVRLWWAQSWKLAEMVSTRYLKIWAVVFKSLIVKKRVWDPFERRIIKSIRTKTSIR